MTAGVYCGSCLLMVGLELFHDGVVFTCVLSVAVAKKRIT